MLQRKNGAAPISGSARLMPPPWSSSWPRSSEMTILGVLRARQMRLDLVGEPVHVDDRAGDAVVGEAVEAMVDERPARHLDERLRRSRR